MESKSLQIIDGHVHIFGKDLQCVRDMLAFERTFHYDVCNFLSCECMDDATQNALGIYLKLVAPHCYAFGGFTYRYQYDFREEMELLRSIGFDGIKMVENKPNLRRKIGIPFNDACYDNLYAGMEQCGYPLLSHVADPTENWDRMRIPQWAFDAGGYYGDVRDGYVDKETLTAEAEDVAARYPKLKLILAHLFFLSDDLPRLDRLLEQYANIYLDVVSGTEMYFNFGKNPQAWREFFLKYQDRLIYGTDNSNLKDPISVENAQITCNMQERFFTQSGVIEAWDKQTRGIELPERVCRKIFHDNFVHLTGSKPNPINHDAAIMYLERRLGNPAMKLESAECRLIEEVLNLL